MSPQPFTVLYIRCITKLPLKWSNRIRENTPWPLTALKRTHLLFLLAIYTNERCQKAKHIWKDLPTMHCSRGYRIKRFHCGVSQSRRSSHLQSLPADRGGKAVVGRVQNLLCGSYWSVLSQVRGEETETQYWPYAGCGKTPCKCRQAVFSTGFLSSRNLLLPSAPAQHVKLH